MTVVIPVQVIVAVIPFIETDGVLLCCCAPVLTQVPIGTAPLVVEALFIDRAV